MELKLSEIIQATKAIAEPLSDEIVIKNVATDSRVVQPGDLFVCLAGKRFDGHDFAKDALKRGASALLVHRPLDFEADVPVLLVRDTTRGLGEIARWLRLQTKAKVIAVSGSVGKTTVKEMLAKVLGQRFKVGRSVGNWNNQIGIPLSIFRFQGDEDFWVLEIGIDNEQDMDELGPIVQPDLAIILNAAKCHLEKLKNQEVIAENECKLLNYLSAEGIAFINREDKFLLEKAKTYSGKKIFFQRDGREVKVKFLGIRETQGVFLLFYNEQTKEVSLPFIGRHFELSLSAVLQVANHFGLELKDVITGLSQVEVSQRFKIIEQDQFILIDDTYNASPLAMRSSLSAARELARNKPLAVVLGDMAELGEVAYQEHLELGRFLREKIKPQLVFYFGEFAQAVSQGYAGEKFFQIKTENEFISYLKSNQFKNGIVLFKGSRCMQMERFLQALKQQG